MIRDNQKLLNGVQVFLDGVLVAVSYILAWYLKFESVFSNRQVGMGVLPMEVYFSALYFLVPGYLILYNMSHLYTPKRTAKIGGELWGILRANALGLVSFFVILYVINQPDFSRSMIFIFFGVNLVLTSLSRIVLRRILRYFRKKGYNQKHVLLIGYSRSAEGYISRLFINPQWGYHVAGILDNNVPIGTSYKGVQVLGTIEQLPEFLAANSYDEITITLSLDHYDRLEELVAICEKSGIHTKFIPDYTSLFPSNPYTEDIMGLPVINIRYVPLTNAFNSFVKRTMDIIGSLFCIILFSPVMLVAAIAVKTTSRGPLIFKQERIGLNGQPFMMYKFRSMVVQSKQEEAKGWTTKDDPRVTKVGAFLRRTSIDEMPQFFNVLMGKMSLVGPRPERPQFVEKFKEEIPRYMVKHQVRPGITGWAQVNGYRGDTSIRKRIEFDIYYIENWTLGLDFRILFETIFHGFVNKNAY